MNISIIKYPLQFKRPAGTSRGVLRTKDTWFLKLYHPSDPYSYGLGEINMFKGLSADDGNEFYEKLADLEKKPSYYLEDIHSSLEKFPSIRFGLETALLDYSQNKDQILFPSKFTEAKDGIPINGLIWMGEESFMKSQIREKIALGFRCLKMKIGAINFETELAILKSIREEYGPDDLELRVDANGAFGPYTALRKLDQLSNYHLHSIEQPIRHGQIAEMQKLCELTILPVALDEELIGIHKYEEKKQLLATIKPHYIILKPALLGGFKSCEEWIEIAESQKIGWWITSALESNVGLNAIAQWTYQLKSKQYQGLGTGLLFENNITSPLQIQGEQLMYHPNLPWKKVDLDD